MSSAEKAKEDGAGIQAEHVKPPGNSSSEATKPQEASVDDVPDPDEDDLDDLDGMTIRGNNPSVHAPQ